MTKYDSYYSHNFCQSTNPSITCSLGLECCGCSIRQRSSRLADRSVLRPRASLRRHHRITPPQHTPQRTLCLTSHHIIMRAIASSFRNLYRQSLEEKTAALDSRTRTELARDVQQFTSSHLQELQQVNDSIEQAQLALEELEEKKRFVGMRLESYQEKLEQRARRLRREEERFGHGVNSKGVEAEVDNNEHQEETKPLALAGKQTRNPARQGVEMQQVQDKYVDTSHVQHDEETITPPCLSMKDLEVQKQRLQNDQEALEKVHLAHAEMKQNVLQLQRKIIILERKREQVLAKTRECRDFLVVAAQMQEDDDDDLEEGPFLPSDQGLEEQDGTTTSRRATEQSRDMP